MQRTRQGDGLSSGWMTGRAVRIIVAALLPVLMSSCGSLSRVFDETRATGAPAENVIVYLIHGDGNYLYHGTSGEERLADEEAVAGAVRVGARATASDVLIFHQGPAARKFLFFAADDGEFILFRHGTEVARGTYRRNREASERFLAESKLVEELTGGKARQASLVYLGHEIPEVGGEGYDESTPRARFTAAEFAREAGALAAAAGIKSFDLIVLSTCNNGTPGVVAGLSTVARWIVASPGDLHLSYMELGPIGEAGSRTPFDGRVAAEAVALQSYERLKVTTLTAVTIAVYDTKKLDGSMAAVRKAWDAKMEAFSRDEETPVLDHGDCADDPVVGPLLPSEGVTSYFWPARFGPEKKKMTHSGWGCWWIHANRLFD